MKTATLGQVRKVLEILDSVSSEQVQNALESGALVRGLKTEHITISRSSQFGPRTDIADEWANKLTTEQAVVLATLWNANILRSRMRRNEPDEELSFGVVLNKTLQAGSGPGFLPHHLLIRLQKYFEQNPGAVYEKVVEMLVTERLSSES